MNELKHEIAAMIAHDGPMTLEQYMALCLSHPRFGYYMSRDPFGAAGDFITAPEISQMFGELIGVWATEAWRLSNSPLSSQLIELGPGRGTLMADALRVARISPEFLDAITVALVETSPVLRDAQRETLSSATAQVDWYDHFFQIPQGPAFIIANEFFDALPVRHYVKTVVGWRERLVGLDSSGALTFGLSEKIEAGLSLNAREGSIIEICPAAQSLIADIAQRLVVQGGVCLVIDYGYTQTSLGDSLQAVAHHSYADPLDAPGDADLTTHVDFAALARAAHSRGAKILGPVTQGYFLQQLGIERRAEALARKATPEQSDEIFAALDRLTGSSDSRYCMGDLFKVMAIAHPDTPDLPGFFE